ncbi:hypothetical protein DY000_02011715 [Brassica cretica]|uniref:Uncharacterized protein n=1 Tax=Brassica cretica TaxID=69181 RepID=A0ABQ7DAK6_BRACR|nr:hypothetical protein DY000_02011715 [Brassica cretica]
MFCGKRREEGSQTKDFNCFSASFSAFLLLFLSSFSIFFFSPLPFPDMDSTPYAQTANFVELLNSQQDCVFRLVEGSVEPTSESVNAHVDVDEDGTNRPPGVKAAKARGKKKPMVEGKEVSDFQTMWELKKEDLVRKERVVKLRLLEKLLGKKEPLSDADEGSLESLVALESQDIVTDCPVSPLVVSRSVVVSCTLVLQCHGVYLFTCLCFTCSHVSCNLVSRTLL